MNDDGHLAKLKAAGNIGVALGKVSDGLLTIDLDQDGYADAFLAANPPLETTLRTRAARGCNIWQRCSGDYPRSCNLTDPAGNKIGEWRGDGCQTIIAGTHPSGVPYRFVVEKPVITIGYEAIIWPPFILPPRATESKRVRRVGENEVVVGCVVSTDSSSIEASWTREIITQLAPTDYHQNNDSLFKLARLVRSYESTMGRLATQAELEFVFDRWCLVARRFWRHTREDYWAEFLQAYHYARIGLDEDPIELALSRAKAEALPEVRGFKDERVRLVAAICCEMQQLVGNNFCGLHPTRPS